MSKNTPSSPLNMSISEFEEILNGVYKDDSLAQGVLRYWFATAKEQRWSLTDLYNRTGVSNSTLSRLFRGIYKSDYTTSIKKLAQAREVYSETIESPDLIDTSLARRMFRVFDRTRALRNVSILWGEMGIGKTAIIEGYQLEHSGRTFAVRFPPRATFMHFVKQVAASMHIKLSSYSSSILRDRILETAREAQSLIIVDELHQAFLTTKDNVAIECCEFLREIRDVAKCGMSLVGTKDLEKAIFRGEHKAALRQLVDRGTMQVSLPSKATKQDYIKFINHYGLEFPDPEKDPEAFQILNDVIKSSGLRKFTDHLIDGASYAKLINEAYTWDHYVTAFDDIQNFSK